MGRNNVGWFEIYVKDMERAKKFYEAVFQVKLEQINTHVDDIEMWSFPMDPEGAGCSGALTKMKDIEPSGINTIVYFSSEDCSIEEKRVLENGGKIHEPKKSIGEYGFISMVYDTEGNMIGVHSLK